MRRSEAEVQADIRSFILSAPFNLNDNDLKEVSLETSVGRRQRIDVEVGCTVIEVKRDLSRGRVKAEAIEQLAGYVKSRGSETGLRYVGVLTDGVEWHCYHLVNDLLVEVSELEIHGGTSPDSLMIWLEGVLGTSQGIYPKADEIRTRLGADSSAHQLDRATLLALYEQNKNIPSVLLKRRLWARLLQSALGTQFVDSDDLFVEHTLLVNTAEIIAHAVLGLDVKVIDATSLTTGLRFDESGVYGVVEADFFDWVVEIPFGDRFITTLARRLDRFVWDQVDHDILKVLYESVIGTETRQRLGEYYTPDWMAELISARLIDAPLNSRVLDPACGSGTFLFHAIKLFIQKAESADIALSDIIENLTNMIIGMDLHPVAVAFARVTYLLAIGRSRLQSPDRPDISIPIYLGDSIQWRQQIDLLTAGSIVIQTDDERELVSSELRFPQELLSNAVLFDKLVNELASRASSRPRGSAPPTLNSVFLRCGVPKRLQSEITKTFHAMCHLHDEDRDHIWSYYVRNLARPLWLSQEKNRVDILVGNPPWLAFRKMTREMQVSFRRLSQERGLWHGAEIATQQDLSGLFVARTIQLYLKVGGKFGFVMPNAAIDREQFAGLRSGKLDGGGELTRLEFAPAWDFRRVRPHIFPRGSCVLFGKRSPTASRLPSEVTFYKGNLKAGATRWEQVEGFFTQEVVLNNESEANSASPYHNRFKNGATVFPRVLFLVDEIESGPLGISAGRLRVRSSTSANEKLPWKRIDRLQGSVERQFVKPVLTSDVVLPFRILSPQKAILPISGNNFIAADESAIDSFPGLSAWWKQATDAWTKNGSSSRLTLSGRLDYMRNLTAQLPIPPLRVVYNKSGMHVVASKVKNATAIIENGLYWGVPFSEFEADYLCAILNSEVTTTLVRPLMSYGKDERNIAKHVWKLPVPDFDPNDEAHRRIAALGKTMENIAKDIPITDSLHFAKIRGRIRDVLSETAEMRLLNAAVQILLSFQN